MKNYAKIGNRKGKTAYRTPSPFRIRKHIRVTHQKSVIHNYSTNKKYYHP
ncbi:MAG: hypothetical protein AAB972_03680 [Patescibacteria group bacterium]